MKRKRILIGVTAILACAVLFWVFTERKTIANDSPVVKEEYSSIEQHVETLYGIPVDSYQVVSSRVKRNEMVGTILSGYGVSQKEIYEISKIPAELFDARHVKAGNQYAVFLDSLGARYFIYEKDNINYAVIHLEDSIHVEVHEKPVIIATEEVSGEITSNLWEAFRSLGANPFLAVELSEIYAWSIDFFGLQKGDRFKVIYDEAFVDSVSAGVKSIHAAWFLHAGHEYWAIPFYQDSVLSFFDENGNSLRKAFLKAPLRYSRISSRFSNSRMHPVLKIRRPHHGIDYAAPVGTPVEAVGDGQVIAAAYERGGGNYVKIKHNGVYSTTYMHLSRFGKGIRQGVYVHQGDVIGYVGSTGLSTGPHLDFRFYKNGQAVDPLKIEAPPVEPVHGENLADFELVKKSMMAALDSIDRTRVIAALQSSE